MSTVEAVGGKPRVLLVSGSAFQIAGMERMMQTVARELRQHAFETEVVIPEQPNASDLMRWFQQSGATVVTSRALARLSTDGWRAVPAFVRFLKSRSASLVNLHSPGPHIPLFELISSRLAGVPAVTSIHGFDGGHSVNPMQRLRNIMAGSPLNAAVVVMNRVGMAQQKSRGIAPGKLELIYNAVAVPDKTLMRAAARRDVGLSDLSFVILTLCRLVPDKGVDVLIDAVRRLPEAVLKRTKVLIGGVGDQISDLRAQLDDSTRDVVSFLGHVSDTSAYYAAADVFVMPSRHEPFGLVFLEAAHHGVPSIGTNVGGIPEVIQPGTTGLLVDSENPQQLADAIASLAGDEALRRRLGEAAKEDVRTRFRLDTLSEKYAELFRRVVAAR
jgi:glycosyltransferase involved in cell wall biosynthesis